MATGDQFHIKQIESLQAVDRAVATLIGALTETGRFENTVFVFLSDNGLSWGEHRWSLKKWCTYEECIRIPLWVRVPGVAGRDEDALVNDVDLAPTLAELAGALPPAQLDGLSLAGLIENPLAPWRTENYSEFISPYFSGNKMVFRSVRTDSFLYAEYNNGDREFYDLAIDPLEELNRFSIPAYAQVIADLQKVLQVLRDQ
jgi:arylsulfatase A-like enzyme